MNLEISYCANPELQFDWLKTKQRTHQLILLLALMSLHYSLYAQTPDSIITAFTHSTKTPTTSETVKGTIFYKAPKKLIIKVTEPLLQWIVFEQAATLIYYPDENLALRIANQNISMRSFLQSYIGSTQEDLGLGAAGFQLIKNEVIQGVLYLYWKPPTAFEDELGNTVVGRIEEGVSFIKVYDAQQHLIKQTHFTNYYKRNLISFPLQVTSVKTNKLGEVHEKVIYSEPVFNTAMPHEVANFQLTADVTIKEVD